MELKKLTQYWKKRVFKKNLNELDLNKSLVSLNIFLLKNNLETLNLYKIINDIISKLKKKV